MKTKNILLVLVFVIAPLATLAALAAQITNAPPQVGTSSGLGGAFSGQLELLIPLAVPMLIATLKSEIPKIPGWMLPILAPALGAGADYLAMKAGLPWQGPIVGALLGSAGVGIRELKDQVQQRVVGSPQQDLPPEPAAPAPAPAPSLTLVQPPQP